MSVDKKNGILIVDENSIKNKIYIIRGQKVMLDFDLAAIYGYTTKRFNEQVKNNINKFDEDFMFQLTREELNSLVRSHNYTSGFANENDVDFFVRSQNAIANQRDNDDTQSFNMTDKGNDYLTITMRSKKTTSRKVDNIESKNFVRSQIVTSPDVNLFAGNNGGTRYLPYAFTEQGIYMLMTVLKGDLAVKQSKALIRLFKSMKDYLVEKNELSSINDVISLTSKVNNHDSRLLAIENRLAVIADSLIDPNKYKEFVVFQGNRIEAREAYINIFATAKKSLLIVDDYINIKTLNIIKTVNSNIAISIISDNIAGDRLDSSVLQDFYNDTKKQLKIYKNKSRFHDRLIFVDYGYESEKVYLSGASIKDTGGKVSCIIEISHPQIFHQLIDSIIEDDDCLFTI